MYQYEIAIYGTPIGDTKVRKAVAKLSFSAVHNLEAIEYAKGLLAEAEAEFSYAVLRHQDHGVIWEDGPKA